MLEEESPHEVEGIYTKAFPNKNYQRVALSWLETLANPYFLAMDSQQMANRYFYLETSRGSVSYTHLNNRKLSVG